MNREGGGETPDPNGPSATPPQGGEGESPSEDTPSLPPLGPLPPRHGYTPEQVARHQRERLLAALAATVAERGYVAVTVGEIAAAAHVSRRVFYQHFETKEECFLAAFDAVYAHLRRLMAAAVEPYEGDWPRQALAALGAALDFFASEPSLARLCLLEAAGAGPALRRRFLEIAAEYSPYMAVGRAEGAARSLPGSTEAAVIGALGSRLTRQLASEGASSLPAQLPALGEFLLTPYLGAERARALVLEWQGEGGEGELPCPGGVP